MWILTVITIIPCLLLLLPTIRFLKNLSRMKRLTANIPGPKTLPLIGNLHHIPTDIDDLLEVFIAKWKEHGSTVVSWLGPYLVIFIASVEDIQFILSSKKLTYKSKYYSFLSPWLGNGLLLANGESWQRKRKLFTPAFHFQSIASFVDIFNSNASLLTKKLEMEVGKPGFDVTKPIKLSALDAMIEILTGVKVHFQIEDNSELCEVFHEIENALIKRLSKPWLYPDWLFRLSPSGKKTYKNISKLYNLIAGIMEVKRQKKLQTNLKIEDNEDTKIEGRLLDILMDYSVDGVGFTDEEIIKEVATFMEAGFISSSAAVAFTFYALMKHQDIQEKVVEELNELFGNSNRMPTHNDLLNMKYLDSVIKESLRLYTPIPYIAREVTEDIILPSGYNVPKGATVVPFLAILHKSPELYQDPEVFNPDRFNTDNFSQLNPYAFVPFSAGPRNCIGQKYAALELKTFISSVLRKYKILPPLSGFPDIKLVAQASLLSKTGINLRIIHRKNNS